MTRTLSPGETVNAVEVRMWAWDAAAVFWGSQAEDMSTDEMVTEAKVLADWLLGEWTLTVNPPAMIEADLTVGTVLRDGVWFPHLSDEDLSRAVAGHWRGAQAAHQFVRPQAVDEMDLLRKLPSSAGNAFIALWPSEAEFGDLLLKAGFIGRIRIADSSSDGYVEVFCRTAAGDRRISGEVTP